MTELKIPNPISIDEVLSIFSSKSSSAEDKNAFICV